MARLVLANYPNRDGRIGNGVGLDTPAGTTWTRCAHWRRRLRRRGRAGRRQRADRTPARRAHQRPPTGRARDPRDAVACRLRGVLRRAAEGGPRRSPRAGARRRRDPFFLTTIDCGAFAVAAFRWATSSSACSRRAATTSIRRPATTTRTWCRRTAISPSTPGCARQFGATPSSTWASTAIWNGCRARRWRCRPTAFPRRRSGRCRTSIPSSSTIPAKAPRPSAAPRRSSSTT